MEGRLLAVAPFTLVYIGGQQLFLISLLSDERLLGYVHLRCQGSAPPPSKTSYTPSQKNPGTCALFFFVGIQCFLLGGSKHT